MAKALSPATQTALLLWKRAEDAALEGDRWLAADIIEGVAHQLIQARQFAAAGRAFLDLSTLALEAGDQRRSDDAVGHAIEALLRVSHLPPAVIAATHKLADAAKDANHVPSAVSALRPLLPRPKIAHQ